MSNQDIKYAPTSCWQLPQSDKQRILTKAIKKAIAGGWEFTRVDMLDVPKELAEWALNPYEPRYPTLIYSKDFAKALWGEEKVVSNCHQKSTVHEGPRLDGKELTKPIEQYTDKQMARMTHRMICPECKQSNGSTVYLGWQYFLQQMVIAEDPIKYLGDNL